MAASAHRYLCECLCHGSEKRMQEGRGSVWPGLESFVEGGTKAGQYHQHKQDPDNCDCVSHHKLPSHIGLGSPEAEWRILVGHRQEGVGL